jgi:chromosome segregation ATPase
MQSILKISQNTLAALENKIIKIENIIKDKQRNLAKVKEETRSALTNKSDCQQTIMAIRKKAQDIKERQKLYEKTLIDQKDVAVKIRQEYKLASDEYSNTALNTQHVVEENLQTTQKSKKPINPNDYPYKVFFSKWIGWICCFGWCCEMREEVRYDGGTRGGGEIMIRHEDIIDRREISLFGSEINTLESRVKSCKLESLSEKLASAELLIQNTENELEKAITDLKACEQEEQMISEKMINEVNESLAASQKNEEDCQKELDILNQKEIELCSEMKVIEQAVSTEMEKAKQLKLAAIKNNILEGLKNIEHNSSEQFMREEYLQHESYKMADYQNYATDN